MQTWPVAGERGGTLLARDWASQGGGPFWDSVSERWLEAHPQRLCRQHSDRVNAALLERWLPVRLGTVLKTDVFDEAVSAGLYPALAERADRVVGVDASIATLRSRRGRELQTLSQRAEKRTLSSSQEWLL
jgi:hypothetical protein